MRELSFIRWIRSRSRPASDVPVGPGDDCAVVRPGSRSVLLKTDMVIGGVHFDPLRTTPRQAGRKAMARSLSDAAAMAGVPRHALVAAALARGTPERDARALYRGLDETARRFGVVIVGGDTAVHDGPLVVTVSLLGVPAPRPILRSGARPGDALFVTGALGGSILGRHLSFTPRVREALSLARSFTVHAMIDVSDGLARDLGHLCRASGVGAVLEAERIPVSAAARRLTARTGGPPLDHALRDGEDYELLFTLSPRDADRLERRPPFRVPVTRIGRIVRGHGLSLRTPDGKSVPLSPKGYEHRG